MPVSKLYIHCNWSTKNRFPYLTGEVRKPLHQHILNTSELNSIELLAINGWVDHIHVLMKLHPVQSLAGTIHQLKGESSSWINRVSLTKDPFSWQYGYYAETINFRQLQPVMDYIRSQEIHHKKMTYNEELKKGIFR